VVGVQLEFAGADTVGLILGNLTGAFELRSVNAPGIGLGFGISGAGLAGVQSVDVPVAGVRMRMGCKCM
jgi:hypothetical protein